MNTLEFLRQILPDSGRYVIAYSEPVINAEGKEERRFRHISFSSLESTAEKISELDKKENVTVFHACASYQDFGRNRLSRTADKVLEVKSFWLDLDCGEEKAAQGKGYASQQEALKAVSSFIKENGFPRPLVIDSGYGLHCYWILDKAIPAAEWKQTALKLKEVFKQNKIITDPSRTSDLASILRPVGSHNKKYGASKIVESKNSPCPVEYEVLRQKIFSLAGEDPLAQRPAFLGESAADENSNLARIASNYEYNAEKIAQKCAVMRYFRDTQGDLNYEAWRGAIGILKFCKNGRELAFKWSEKREETGHTNTDVATRFDTWGAKPTVCTFFKENCPHLCEGCQNKTVTPLTLGREVDVKEEPPKEIPEEQRPVLPLSEEVHPDGYFWDTGLEAMAVRSVDAEGKETIKAFTNYRFYLNGRIRDTSGEHYCTGVLYDPFGGKRDFLVSAKAISTGGATLLGELGKAEISPSNTPSSEKLMVGYLRDSMNKLRHKVDVTRSFTCYGWQDDKEAFLLGDKLYKKGIVDDKVRLRGYAENKFEIFKTADSADIQEYSEALNSVYARDGFESMQYAMGSLWGAPLCALVNDALYKGIPCALTGVTSGRGKTTAFTAALYAFGNAEKMTIKGEQGATPNARTAFLGAMQSLPILIDEITNIRAGELSNLAYVVSNGGEKDRLRMDRAGDNGTAFANTASWCTQVGLTGNSCLIDRLSENGTSDAEAMRIFEIRTDNYPVPALDPMEVIGALSRMQANAGAVGPKYIQYIMDNRVHVEALMAETMRQVMDDKYLAVEPKYRFYRWHMVTSITAIKIMNTIGVTRFDVDKVIEFAKEAVMALCNASQERNEMTADEILFAFMHDKSEEILTTRRMDDIPADELDRIPNRRYIGRLIRGDKNIHDNKVGLFIVSRKELSSWCLDNRVDKKKLEDDLEAMGILWKRNERFVLTRGVPKLPSAQVRCNWIIVDKLLKKFEEDDDNDEPTP